MALLTIAIPTYKREASLRKCINSIAYGLSSSEFKQLKLIISDNDPNSTISNMLQEKSFPEELRILYSQNSENIGADKNNLRCIELSEDSEFWWLLGDDDYPQPGLVSTLLRNLSSKSPDCTYLEYRGQLWTTFLPKKPFHLFSQSIFLSYVNFHITFISSFILKLSDVKNFSSDPNRPKGTFLDQLGWLLPIIGNSKKFLVYPRQAFTGGQESTGGYNLTEVFVTNYWVLWHRYIGVFKLKSPWLPKLICRSLMLIGFYPQILTAQRSKSRSYIFDSRKSKTEFRKEFGLNPLYWIFVEPCFELPAKSAQLYCRLSLPLRLAFVLLIIAVVRVNCYMNRNFG